jgi:hypothetical protein
MQSDRSLERVQRAPDFVEHIRERLGMTRPEAERILGDWVANYPRLDPTEQKPAPSARS